ncbi:unnamed protein product [Cuscuta epithymum]|uniref:U6 snRNA phosphodiesterase 1 n=1 Tax=Cuscuta epithymum TaxID=186058 RepID=A0AAV0BZY3_9ASTE|nr:unnamed protein product [Cuscuta epithymum]
MLRQRLQFQRRYWINFNKWEVFVNDDGSRTFLSLEIVTGGLFEITKQVQAVNEVYRLHNLPEFYKVRSQNYGVIFSSTVYSTIFCLANHMIVCCWQDPRPHISIAWALGDISDTLKRVVQVEMKRYLVGSSPQKPVFTSKFSGILCKVGSKCHEICKFQGE